VFNLFKFLSDLVTVGEAVSTQFIKNPDSKKIQVAVVSVVNSVLSELANANPDGTPATVAYVAPPAAAGTPTTVVFVPPVPTARVAGNPVPILGGSPK
jgi:hypothetical protein